MNKYTISQFKKLLTKYGITIDGEIERIFDVYYYHIQYEDNSDLYITKFGVPFYENLSPDNFLTDENWFKNNAIRLSGTSATYKIRTKEVYGRYKEVVIKYNRMGQDIPGSDGSEDLMSAEFNSPFEEFSLVMELKGLKLESPCGVITQKPLAIYVPGERFDPWRMGRKEYKMKKKLETHHEVELDMFRSYVVVYEWINGIDAAFACREGILEEEQMVALTLKAEKEMKDKGFVVKDRKPHHIIIRPDWHGKLAYNENEKVRCGIVDYELLARTPEREETMKKIKRLSYLAKQKDRFTKKSGTRFLPHLKQVNILGVDYVYGHAESTHGALWVVGRDADLFDYFLPERWEHTPRTKLSAHHEIHHTLTKDNIHLVWKVSKVGMLPDVDPFVEEERKILEHGFNSPFEEISFAIELSKKGIRTVYPRAIYMFGKKTAISDSVLDNSRYMSHRQYSMPDGDPILKKDHNYIIIWGYWNGPDEKLAEKDGDYLEGISALRAYGKGIITREEYIALLRRKEERLANIGIEDLHLRGTHVLLSLDSAGMLICDAEGVPDMRICNFELLKRKQ
ncbi:MAG: hypothetical protein JSV25_12515 [Spirochaetota bacterium]|nr:MAG: hypothetical protein JSV25_12515 [Spirochaetota bacterium]